jgi:hypothetical protein
MPRQVLLSDIEVEALKENLAYQRRGYEANMVMIGETLPPPPEVVERFAAYASIERKLGVDVSAPEIINPNRREPDMALLAQHSMSLQERMANETPTRVEQTARLVIPVLIAKYFGNAEVSERDIVDVSLRYGRLLVRAIDADAKTHGDDVS